MIELEKNPGEIEIGRLVYGKYLFHQGKRFLDNISVESYYNISIILCSNAVDIFINVLAFCRFGSDHTKEKISDILNKLNKNIPNFPYAALNRIIEARNGVYHRADLKTYSVCKEIIERAEIVLRECYRDYLGKNYDQISLVDIIKDLKIKEPLKRSEDYLTNNEWGKSIISACESFAMFESRLHNRVNKQISTNNSGLFWNTEVSWQFMARKLGIEKRNIVIGKIDTDDKLRIFSEHIDEQVNKKIVNLARRFDLFVLLGPLYEDYKHFERIRPLYHMTLGGFQYNEGDIEKKDYQKEDAEFVFNFVLNATINIESKLNPIEIRSLDGALHGIIE
ncbi:MAG: hypothetical protein ABSA44_04880 [Bacteroidota bacterium]|jgi:hypothetical protein